MASARLPILGIEYSSRSRPWRVLVEGYGTRLSMRFSVPGLDRVHSLGSDGPRLLHSPQQENLEKRLRNMLSLRPASAQRMILPFLDIQCSPVCDDHRATHLRLVPLDSGLPPQSGHQREVVDIRQGLDLHPLHPGRGHGDENHRQATRRNMPQCENCRDRIDANFQHIFDL
jgi:hypothetical protein